MNKPVTHEERIIDSLMKKDVMRSFAAMPGNDDERQEKIRQYILERMKVMNVNTLLNLVRHLSPKHRGCIEGLLELTSKNVAKEILQKAIKMT